MISDSTPLLKLLHSVLNNSSLSSIISWSDDGLSFVVYSLTDFTDTILKNYYPSLSSKKLIKQLKNFGFTQTKHGSAINFQHQNFQRSNPSQLKKIKRHTQNPSRKKNLVVNELSKKFRILESSQMRMEESMGNLKEKFTKIIELNKYLIAELDSSQEYETKKFEELKQHLYDYEHRNINDQG